MLRCQQRSTRVGCKLGMRRRHMGEIGKRGQFEAAIRSLTQPINGQLPRAWMTDWADPLSARVVLVGMNQATGYDAGQISHERHVDALFNRNGQTCRGLYDEMRGGIPSPTRSNLDVFRGMLAEAGVKDVLESNVVCYSTPMSRELGSMQHSGGQERGTDIFRVILEFVRPRVLVAHGAGTRKTLGKVLGATLPAPPASKDDPMARTRIGDMEVFLIPSLAPPAFNRWQRWSHGYLQSVASQVACSLDGGKRQLEAI